MIKKIFILLFYFTISVCGQQIVRFMIFADTHYYSPSSNFQESILYELTLAAIREQVDFVFITGDLVLYDYAEEDKIDSLLSDWKFILDTLYENGIRVYACRGNNDVNSQLTWKKLFSDIYTLPDNGPEEEKYYTYSLEYDNFLFISLDQYTEYERINQVWLDEQLVNSNKQFVFVAGHEPAFKLFHTNCLAAYPEERNALWNSLLLHKGIIYFCGHDHFYDHSIISDGDENSLNDMHQIIAGTGGGGIHPDSDYDGDNGEWVPERIFHEGAYGYVLVEVNYQSLQTTWKHRTEKNVFEDGGDSYSYIVTSVTKDEIDYDYYLSQNYPNPFNPSTKINWQSPKGSWQTIKIYDLLGREVVTLVDEYRPAGVYEVEFSIAAGLTSGMYFYQLKIDDYVNTRKMVLMK